MCTVVIREMASLDSTRPTLLSGEIARSPTRKAAAMPPTTREMARSRFTAWRAWPWRHRFAKRVTAPTPLAISPPLDPVSVMATADRNSPTAPSACQALVGRSPVPPRTACSSDNRRGASSAAARMLGLVSPEETTENRWPTPCVGRAAPRRTKESA